MKKHKWSQTLGWLLWCLFILVGAFTAGYFLTMPIYKIIGRPPEPVAYVLYGLLSLAVLALECFVFFFIVRHAQQGKDHDWLHDSFFKVASDAMSRIARGDFSVFLDPQDFRDHRELVESINTMAQALGTLETLRQDFVSNVSHEIQSPLTSIGGCTKPLRGGFLSSNLIDFMISSFRLILLNLKG